MSATIRDIAREAGVSTATVSRVLNSSVHVNEETKEKVLSVVKKHNYSPSTIARGLKTKSIKTIAIVVKSFTMLHHMRIADQINNHFSQKGYDIMMFETGMDEEGMSLFLRRMMDKSIDGIIFIGSTFQLLSSLPETETLLESIPVVISNGWLKNSYGVLVDEKEGSKMLAEHLYSKGRRNLIFLHSSNTESCRNKIIGFKEFVSTKEDAVGRVVTITEEISEIDEALSSISFDGVVAEEDLLALKVMKILGKRGIRAPEDVSVGGFNNSMMSSLVTPSLTSVDNKAIEQGVECAIALEKILSSSKDAPKEKKILKTIPAELIVREST
ncbi:MAG: LacI family transcriptional regulator [Spirochaetales bacterium]|nr:LacI family transcriptional regulator [Spirochaetales bacterium]